MKPFTRIAVYFAGGLLVPMLLWSTISVYGFDQYERAWGHGGSVQVLWALSLASATGALASVGTAVRWLAPKRSVSGPVAFAAGIAFFLVSAAGVWLLGLFDGGISGPPALLWFIAGPAVLSVALARLLGKESSS